MTGSSDRRLRNAAAAAGPPLLLASAGYAAAGGATQAEIASVVVIAAAFLAAGLITWTRRPDNRTGRLMVAAGLAELMVPLVGPPWLVLAPLGIAAGVAVTVLVGYLILAFPSGELRSSVGRAWIVAMSSLLLVVRIAVLISLEPSTRGWGGSNPYLVIRDPDVAAGILTVRLVAVMLVVTVFAVLVVGRWVRASGPGRRAFTPVFVAGACSATVYLVASAVSLGDIPADLKTTLLWTQDMSTAFFPIGFLVGFLRIHLVRSAIAGLVVELGETPTPAQLRAALANALGDRSLEVAYWSQERGSYVDADGAPLTLPASGSGRAITQLERDGTPIAAIIHDPALLDDPGLVASVASAMRLAVENERLEAEVEAQLDEVRASRARIVEAGDAERRRLERDLHDGAQQRLVSLALSLRAARTRLGEDVDPALRTSLEQASEEAHQALNELRELARGIHPAILTEAGLGAAVESLADRSVVPVLVEGATDERFAPIVERTAYFVVSEALANVNKHARSTRATVRLERRDGDLVLEIRDDGVGGADASHGSGLRGLADRLAAIDGTLRVDSPAGAGTRLEARIPVEIATTNAG